MTLTITTTIAETTITSTRVSTTTYTPSPIAIVSPVITSHTIPECHNAWDIALIVLLVFFGVLILLLLCCLAFLWRRPFCSMCCTRHAPKKEKCPANTNGGDVPGEGDAPTGYDGPSSALPQVPPLSAGYGGGSNVAAPGGYGGGPSGAPESAPSGYGGNSTAQTGYR